MNFVDALMSKFKPKKIDQSELNRLRHAPPPTERKEGAADTPLGSIRPPRSKVSSSVTRLRAFVKHKTLEEIAAEDTARQLANEQFTDRAIHDSGFDS